MKKKLFNVIALAAVLASIHEADAITYSGNLTRAGGGITVGGGNPGGNWDSDDITLSWRVSNETAGLLPGWWHYSYTWTGEDPGLSHLIVEVSPNTTGADYEFGSGTELRTLLTGGKTEFSEDSDGNSNPGMPGGMTSVKHDGSGIFEFESNRAPVWGDFYAKGGQSYAYNTGFLIADPLAPAADGSIQNHILRPDTTIPDGGATASLIGLGFISLAAFARRQKR